jgi:hypothetical protein
MVYEDLVNDHLAMSESQTIKCVKRFQESMVNLFRPVYSRAPNAQDMAKPLKINKACGFSAMLGSIDYMQ